MWVKKERGIDIDHIIDTTLGISAYIFKVFELIRNIIWILV